jgi:Phage QLRG family, putative DNA packaging.
VNGYATLSDVKAAARITDSIDDSLLEIAIESSSRDIDAYTERVFFSSGATAVARVYIPQDIYLVETDDIISVTTIKSDSGGNGTFDITWAATDYQLEPLNGLAGGISTPTTRIRAIGDYLWPVYEPRNVNSNQASVQVTGVFGFLRCRLLSSRQPSWPHFALTSGMSPQQVCSGSRIWVWFGLAGLTLTWNAWWPLTGRFVSREHHIDAGWPRNKHEHHHRVAYLRGDS